MKKRFEPPFFLYADADSNLQIILKPLTNLLLTNLPRAPWGSLGLPGAPWSFPGLPGARGHSKTANGRRPEIDRRRPPPSATFDPLDAFGSLRQGRRRRIAGRPADFLKIAPGLILGPRGGQNRIPREKIFRFDPFS